MLLCAITRSGVLGLPFSDSYYGEESIGDTHVFLPVFDEHTITTGEYVSGPESLALPNATWGDIFGDTMPVYDPNYIPPEPGPGPTPVSSGRILFTGDNPPATTREIIRIKIN